MTQEQLDFMNTHLKGDNSYRVEVSYLADLFKNYETLSRHDQYKIFDNITRHANESRWSRRKLYGLMNQLTLDSLQKQNPTEQLFDDIDNYLDALSGNSSWRSVIRLNRDPEDQLELSNYVRSFKWIYKDNFTDKDQ